MILNCCHRCFWGVSTNFWIRPATWLHSGHDMAVPISQSPQHNWWGLVLASSQWQKTISFTFLIIQKKKKLTTEWYTRVCKTYLLNFYHQKQCKAGSEFGSLTIRDDCLSRDSWPLWQQWLSQLTHVNVGNSWSWGSLSDIATSINGVFLLNIFLLSLRFPGEILDCLWGFDSNPNVLTDYGHENDDGDCCDCVGSNHLALYWIRIVVTNEKSPCWENPKFCNENGFQDVQDQ